MQRQNQYANYVSEDSAVVENIERVLPADVAQNLLLSILSESQLHGYSYCLDNNIPLLDIVFQTWKCLKELSAQMQPALELPELDE